MHGALVKWVEVRVVRVERGVDSFWRVERKRLEEGWQDRPRWKSLLREESNVLAAVGSGLGRRHEVTGRCVASTFAVVGVVVECEVPASLGEVSGCETTHERSLCSRSSFSLRSWSTGLA